MTIYPPETQRALSEPENRTLNRLWLVVVLSLASVLLGSAATLVALSFREAHTTPAVSPEIVLSLFTSVMGFLAGLFVPSPAKKS